MWTGVKAPQTTIRIKPVKSGPFVSELGPDRHFRDYVPTLQQMEQENILERAVVPGSMINNANETNVKEHMEKENLDK